jgi:3-oxoacyl-(acyl-carrier-protein) synthase
MAYPQALSTSGKAPIPQGTGRAADDDYFTSRVANIEKEAAQQDKDALAMYRMLEGADPRVVLAVWGLAAHDVGVLSIHGTSTNVNVSVSSSLILSGP